MTQTINDPQYRVGTAADIQHLQQWLAKQGLYHGPVNGVMNSAFQNSMAAWQRTQGLVVTGTVDYQSVEHVNGQANALSHTGPAVTPEVRDFVSKTYGTGMMAYLNDPEVGPLLIQAAKEHSPQTVLAARLQQTNFWRRTTDSQRSWEELKVTNPGEARVQLQNARLMIVQQAQSLGLHLSDVQLNQLADDAKRFAWDDPSNRNLLVNIMVNTLKASPKVMQAGGSYATALDEVKAIASNYLIKTDDKHSADIAGKMVQNVMQSKDVADYFGRIAKVRHPGLAHVIDSGVDLHTFLDPYRQDIAKELDLSPDAVDFMNDPRWSKLLDWNPDGKGPRMATTAEALQVARSQPQWWSTTNGRAAGASLGLTLARGMGLSV